MTATLADPRPAGTEDVDDYHVLALRWWHGQNGAHRPSTCGCLPCADLRRYLGWPPLSIVIGVRIIESLPREAQS